jgi:hypothetical protein
MGIDLDKGKSRGRAGGGVGKLAYSRSECKDEWRSRLTGFFRGEGVLTLTIKLQLIPRAIILTHFFDL